MDGGNEPDSTPAADVSDAAPAAPAAAPAAPTTGSGTLPGDEYALRAHAAESLARNDASNSRGRTTGDVYAKQYGAKATPAPAARSAAPQTPRTRNETPPRLRPAAGNGGGVGPASPGYASQLNEQSHAIPNMTGAIDSQRNEQYHAVPVVPGRGRVVASPTPTTSHSAAQPAPKASPSSVPSPRSTVKSAPGAGTVLKPVIPTYRGW